MTAHVTSIVTSKDIQSAAACVTETSDLSKAFNAFSDTLSEYGWQALIVAGTSPKAEDSATVHYCALEQSFEIETLRMCAAGRLPINRPEAFEPIDIDALKSIYGDNTDADLQKYLSDFATLEYRRVVMVPVRLDDMQLNFFIGTDAERLDEPTYERLKSLVSHFFMAVAGRFAAIKAKANAAGENDGALKKKISMRERECLLWCANGKSSYEISKILTLSEHTVNRYLGMVCDKLDAVNRPHAVSKAIKLGLIDLTIIS